MELKGIFEQENYKLSLEICKVAEELKIINQELKILKQEKYISESSASNPSDIRTKLLTSQLPQVNDRPTQSMIISINDKLIQLSKIHEHGLDCHGKRFAKLEDGFKMLSKQMQKEYQLESVNRSSIISSDETIYKQLDHISTVLEKQQEVIETQRKINEDRLDQFFSMLLILQDTHPRIANNNNEEMLSKLFQKVDKIEKFLEQNLG
jgi:hypothetical protein